MIGDIPIESTVAGICDVQYDTQAADLFCTKALTQEPKLCIVCPFLHCYVYMYVCACGVGQPNGAGPGYSGQRM